MSESTSLTSGISGRYATALFSLCEEEKSLSNLQKDIDTLVDLLEASRDFCLLIESPIYKREEQESVMVEVAKSIKLSEQTKNLLCLLARKGRLFLLPDFINDVKSLLNNDKDEMVVEVISAASLTKGNTIQLEKRLGALIQKKARVEVRVDKSLISGIIVKLGSKMIDTSTKLKLAKLQTKMKEVN